MNNRIAWAGFFCLILAAGLFAGGPDTPPGGSGIETDPYALHTTGGTVTGGATFSSSLGVTGPASFSGKVVMDNASVTRQLQMNNASASGALDITGQTTLASLTVNQNASFAKDVFISSGSLDLTSVTDIATPAVNHSDIYAKTTQGHTRPCYRDDDGNEYVMTRDTVTIVRNVDSVTITKGQPVYVTGTTGGVPEVKLARANSVSTIPAIGLANESIAQNAYGNVMTLGVMTMDTSAFSAPNTAYVSTTVAGNLTTTRPSGPSAIYVQRVGTVLSQSTTGLMLVTIAPFVGNMESGTVSAWTAGNTVSQIVASSGYTVYQGNTESMTTASSSWVLPLSGSVTSITPVASQAIHWEASIAVRQNASPSAGLITIRGDLHSHGTGTSLTVLGSDEIRTSAYGDSGLFGCSASVAGGVFRLLASGSASSLWQVQSLRFGGL